MDIEGRKLKITVSSFAVAMRLLKALAESVKGDGIKFDLSTFKINFDALEQTEVGDIGPIIQAGLSLATDENLRNVLFECAERALIGDDKVDMDFFEEEKNRKHYYPVMVEIARVNLAPFFGGLNSMSLNLGELIGNLQKQK